MNYDQLFEILSTCEKILNAIAELLIIFCYIILVCTHLKMVSELKFTETVWEYINKLLFLYFFSAGLTAVL